MADFQERIGFDASQAISALNKLSASLDIVNQNIREMAALTGRPLPNFSPAAASVENYRKKGVRANQEIASTAKTSKRSVGELTVSWETLSRVIQTQIIIRTMNLVRDLFIESADAAAEFQEQVARTAQIADSSAGGIEGLSNTIRELSIELGQPLQEVAEATFEGLQNDLGNTEETIKILRTEAQELALVTGGTLTDSINALSSVIKAYSLSAEEAEGLSDKFFATIDTGRVTLDEIQSSLGTVNSLAVQAGVSVEEVFASISAITLSGTKASVAMTQLRNVLQKGIKPTEELASSLERLGADTFPELVEESGGFREALRRIFDDLENDPERISKAFNTIRGSLGVFNLMADEGSEFERILGEVTDSAGRAEQAIADINRTDFRAAERQGAQLSAIMEEIGEDTLAAKVAATELFLTILPNAEAMRNALLGIGTAAVVMGTRLVIASAAAGGLAASLAPLLPLAASFAAVVAGASIVANVAEWTDEFQDLNRELEHTNLRGLELADNLLLERHTQESNELAESFQRQNRAIAAATETARTGYQGVRDEMQETSDELDRLGASAVASFTNDRDRFLSRLEDFIESVDQKIKDVTDRIGDVRQDQFQFNFERSLRGLDELEQAELTLTRAEGAASLLQTKLEQFRAGEATIEDVNKQLEILDDRTRASVRAADAAGDPRTVARAEAQRTQFFETQIDALEQQRRTLNNLNRQELRENFVRIKGITELRKEQAETVENLLSQTTAEGQPKTTQQITEDLKEAETLLQGFKEQSEEIADTPLVQAAGLEGEFRAIDRRLQQSFEQLEVDWTNVRNQLQNKLQEQEFEAVVRLEAVLDQAAISSGLQRALTGADVAGDPLRSIRQRVDAAQKLVQAEQDRRQEIEDSNLAARQGLAQAREEVAEAEEFRFGDLATSLFEGRAPTGFGTAFDRFATGIRDATNEAENLTGVVMHDLDNLERQRQKLVEIQRQVQENTTISEERQKGLLSAVEFGIKGIDEQAEAVRERDLLDPESAAEAKERLSELNEEIRSINEENGINILNEDLETTREKGSQAQSEIGNIGDQANNSLDPVGNLTSTTGGLATVADAAADAFNRMAEAARNADAASGVGSGPVLAAHGGQVNYRAAGGAGRGQDKIPAMLSPEEFVVNPRSSRNFFSQLQALNAGGQVDSGGGAGNSVTNVRIGDVNVSSGGQVSSDTGRQIAHSLKRELRRSNIRL